MAAGIPQAPSALNFYTNATFIRYERKYILTKFLTVHTGRSPRVVHIITTF